jgi:hypothetical protein
VRVPRRFVHLFGLLIQARVTVRSAERFPFVSAGRLLQLGFPFLLVVRTWNSHNGDLRRRFVCAVLFCAVCTVAVSDLTQQSEAPFVKRGENALRPGRALAVFRLLHTLFGFTPILCMFHSFAGFARAATLLILPVVICLSQRLIHACLSINAYTVKLRMAH